MNKEDIKVGARVICINPEWGSTGSRRQKIGTIRAIDSYVRVKWDDGYSDCTLCNVSSFEFCFDKYIPDDLS